MYIHEISEGICNDIFVLIKFRVKDKNFFHTCKIQVD